MFRHYFAILAILILCSTVLFFSTSSGLTFSKGKADVAAKSKEIIMPEVLVDAPRAVTGSEQKAVVDAPRAVIESEQKARSTDQNVHDIATAGLLSEIGALERHRPVYHFTPLKFWMNDPNGMFYKNSVFHLYYQHNPKQSTWGPVHWGHATTTDLVHWQHHQKVLSPDSLGYIFSGSAVVDTNNTSGHGPGTVVAFFTHHSAGPTSGVVQAQSVAYSTDDGFTFKKYQRNPVITSKRPDFRDPKVFWDERSKSWIMAVSGGDCIMFYSSQDTRKWKYLSKFGEYVGKHTGAWECPELFRLKAPDGSSHHVLFVSVNKGAPNGGSGTQYFVGSWDGKQFDFKSTSAPLLWLDYGTDNYAGVTWSGFGDDSFKRYIGWMSNWMYAQFVTTQIWRSAMTLPRDLRLCRAGERHKDRGSASTLLLCTSWPQEVLQAFGEPKSPSNGVPLVGLLELEIGARGDAQISIYSSANDSVHVVFQRKAEQVVVNRSQSSFKPDKMCKIFGKLQKAPWTGGKVVHVALDRGSLELLADGGRTALTAIFYPKADFDRLQVHGAAWKWRYFLAKRN